MEGFEPLRAALAEQAAARGAGPVLAGLRQVTTGELLCPAAPVRHAADLNAELDALCASLRECVRRRPGWLYFAPAAGALPVAARPRLIQAAVCCFAAGALRLPEGRAVIRCEQRGGAAELTLQGGAGGCDAPALLRALAGQAGGCAVIASGAPFAAALRLPLAADLPLRPAAQAADLLADKFSLPYLYLGGYAARPS